MQKLDLKTLRSIYFRQDQKPNIFLPQARDQDVIDFDEIMQDPRYSEVGIVAEPPGPADGARGNSVAGALIEGLERTEFLSRDHFDQAFKHMESIESTTSDLPKDITSLTRESIRVMENMTTAQYHVSIGHLKLNIACKVAHMVGDGVKTLYRQQG